MADGPSAEEAAAGGDTRLLSRERHKWQDASSSALVVSTGPSSALSTGQDARHRSVHGDAAAVVVAANSLDRVDGNSEDNDSDRSRRHPHYHDRFHHHHHHHHHYHHHHYRYQQQQQQQERIGGDCAVGGIFNNLNNSAGCAIGGDCARVVAPTPTMTAIRRKEREEVYDDEEEDDEDDDEDEEGDDGDEEDDEEEEDESVESARGGGVRLGLIKNPTDGVLASIGSNSSGGGGASGGNNRNGNTSAGGLGGVGGSLVTTMLSGSRSRVLLEDNIVSPNETNGRSMTNYKNERENRMEDVEMMETDEKIKKKRNIDIQQDNGRYDEEERKRGDDTPNDPPPLDIVPGTTVTPTSPSVNSIASGFPNGVGNTGSGGSIAGGASNVKSSSAGSSSSNGSPFKGQVRMAEETLVGPCGKKRCADRYDSSESSDSGVAVSCGECSSSGTSDITEPGSPCSTSSDEGVAIRGASASPLPTLPKLAPSSQIGTRPQWPWTPPLAATACSTYKRLKGEPEAGTLPRSGAADPTSRGSTKGNQLKPAIAPGVVHQQQHHLHHQQHHEPSSQGKITEYFKTQIKPQQPKIKKAETMSVLVAKSSTEFRRPPTVQRNKGGLAKYLGTVASNTRNNTPTSNDWEVRTLAMSPPPNKKSPPVIVPRTNAKMDKKLPKPVPSLPISNDVLKNMPPACKISSLRLTSDASPTAVKPCSPPSTPTANPLTNESVPLDFKGCILSKPHVNENNNLTNGCPNGILGSLRSQTIQDPFSRLSVPENDKKEPRASPAADEEDAEEEEEDSRSSESKTPLSPILSAPTTIRFPARAPVKDRSQPTDSGICRWDKCEASFESSTGLLEHLQAAHINTQTGGDNFVCHWLGCKVQGRTSCSRRWLERHVLSHGGNKPFRCIVDGCGSRFSSQTTLERHVNGHFNQPETSSSSGRRSCENGGKLVRRNGKRLRYRRQPWSGERRKTRLFDYFDSGVMEGLQHRLLELAKSRTQGRLAETPGDSMALTSQILARRVEMDGKIKVLLRWYPQDIEPDEWVLESEVQRTKHVEVRQAASRNPEEVGLALYPAMCGGAVPLTRVKQRRKPVKDS